MDIVFRDQKLAKVFSREKSLQSVYGSDMAALIKRRMMVLLAAPNLECVPHTPPERRHELKGDRKGEFAVDLKHPRRLVFSPHHDVVPLREDGGVDLSKITAIMILKVEDYH